MTIKKWCKDCEHFHYDGIIHCNRYGYCDIGTAWGDKEHFRQPFTAKCKKYVERNDDDV